MTERDEQGRFTSGAGSHGGGHGGGHGGESVVVRELLTILGFDLNETGFKRAEGAFKSLIGFAAEVVHRVFHVGHQLEGLAISAAEAGESAYKAGLRLGVTAEQAQELAFAQSRTAEMSGELSSALFRLQHNAEAARVAGKSLGFESLDKATGRVKPTIALVESLADKMVSIKDPAQRADLAFRTLGRGSQVLIPFLLKGREGIEELRKKAHELGGVLSDEDVQASHDFVMAMKETRFAIDGVWKRIGVALIPTFKRLDERMEHTIVTLNPLIDKGIRVLANVVDTAAKALTTLVDVLVENHKWVELVAVSIATMFLPRLIELGAVAVATAVKTALSWALALAPLLLVAAGFAAIFMLIQDVGKYASGDGKTALGDFMDRFNQEINVNDHPVVKVLKTIAHLIDESIHGIKILSAWAAGTPDMDAADMVGKAIPANIHGKRARRAWQTSHDPERSAAIMRATEAGVPEYKTSFWTGNLERNPESLPPNTVGKGMTFGDVNVTVTTSADNAQAIGQAAADGIRKVIKEEWVTVLQGADSVLAPTGQR